MFKLSIKILPSASGAGRLYPNPESSLSSSMKASKFNSSGYLLLVSQKHQPDPSWKAGFHPIKLLILPQSKLSILFKITHKLQPNIFKASMLRTRTFGAVHAKCSGITSFWGRPCWKVKAWQVRWQWTAPFPMYRIISRIYALCISLIFVALRCCVPIVVEFTSPWVMVKDVSWTSIACVTIHDYKRIQKIS